MNSNDYKKLRRKSIQSMIVMLITGAILLTSLFSFAWLSINNAVNSSSGQVQLGVPPNTIFGIECFPVVTISNGNYTFVNTPVNFNYGLPYDDPAGIVGSIYQKAIILCISVSDTEVFHALQATASAAWLSNVGMEATEEPSIGQNYLSNCIQLTIGTVSGYVFSKTGDPVSFVETDQTGSIVRKNSAVALERNFSDGSGKIYVVLEYNPALTSYYRLGLEFKEIAFDNDIEFSFVQGDND